MKDFLVGLLVILLAVAVLAGGYYLGIILAVLTGIVLIVVAFLCFFVFVCYAVWDWYHTCKRNRQERDP